jgi:ribosomal protein S1
MLEIYSTIVAELVSKEKTGAFFVNANNRFFVPYDEQSWEYNDAPINLLDIGQKIYLSVIAYNYVDGFYICTLKDLSSKNPYKKLFKLPVSTVIRGTVSGKQDEDGRKIIVFPNGSYGKLYGTCRDIQLVPQRAIDTVLYTLWLRTAQAELLLETPTSHTRKMFKQQYLIKNKEDFDNLLEIDTSRLEHGSIIPAHLTRIDPYGLWLSDDNNIIFVDLMEIYWEPQFSFSDLKSGHIKHVYILGYDYVNGYYLGSLKRAIYETPYRELSRFTPSTVFRGKIVQITDDGNVMVLLPNNAIGKLRNNNHFRFKSDEIDVIIHTLSVDADYNHLVFETPDCNSRKEFSPEVWLSNNLG